MVSSITDSRKWNVSKIDSSYQFLVWEVERVLVLLSSIPVNSSSVQVISIGQHQEKWSWTLPAIQQRHSVEKQEIRQKHIESNDNHTFLFGKQCSKKIDSSQCWVTFRWVDFIADCSCHSLDCILGRNMTSKWENSMKCFKCRLVICQLLGCETISEIQLLFFSEEIVVDGDHVFIAGSHRCRFFLELFSYLGLRLICFSSVLFNVTSHQRLSHLGEWMVGIQLKGSIEIILYVGMVVE